MKNRFNVFAVTSIVATLLFSATFASAKPGKNAKPKDTTSTTQPSTPKGPQSRFEAIQKILDGLNLTDDQKEKISQIKQETIEKLQSLKGTLKDLTKEERQAKIKETVGNIREKIAAVLTEEQKTQLKEKMKEARAEKGGGEKPNKKAK